MGMDVYGIEPSSEEGGCFRNNVWWWRPLWSFCESIAEDLIPADNLGHSNDGWGLPARESTQLAERLQGKLDRGEVAQYARARQESLDALPDEPCLVCGGTGRRAEPPHIGPGSMPCNGCDSTGVRRPLSAKYPFSEDNVRAFATFLSSCGGFRIY